MNKKRIVSLCALMIGFTLLANAFLWTEQSFQAIPSIKIGFIAPLSGPFAQWGQSIRRGFDIGLRHTKHRISADYQDDRCQAVQAVSIFQKWIGIDGISLIIGPGCHDGLKAIGPGTRDKKVYLFSTGLLDDEVFRQGYRIINLATQISTEAKYLVDYIGSTGIKSFALIHGTNAFGEEFGEQIPKFLEKKKIMVVANEGVDITEMDFRSVLVKVMSRKPEAVFIHSGELQTLAFLKQFHEANYTVPIYSQYAVETPSLLADDGKWAENLMYSFPVNSSETGGQKLAFEEEYKKAYGDNAFPSATSYFVYDGLMILDKALDECTEKDADCIGNFFKQLKHYKGISGDMAFANDGSNDRPYGIKKVQNAKFVWVSKDNADIDVERMGE